MTTDDGAKAGARAGMGPALPLTKTLFALCSTLKQANAFNAGGASASPLRRENRA
jgi:hypothetical protein